MPDLDTSLALCTFCPNLCRHTCPVGHAEANETLIPRAKMALYRRLRREETPLSVENAEALYACTGCGACAEACHVDVEPAVALFAGRAAAERRGAGHPALADLPARFTAQAEQAARATRDAFAALGEAPGPHRFPSEAQVALLPSCESPAAARAAIAVFERVGAGYVVVADVTMACGGYPLLAAGHADAFRAHAEAMARQLQGYAKLVVACPACAYSMKHDYPAHGVRLRPEIVHLTEFLGPFAPKLQPTTPPTGAAFYHDPCYLGRREGVYDPPRRLLERVLPPGGLREFSRSREESECCGAGGALPLTMPETAAAIAEARLVEPREQGVRTIVTACATCAKRLTRDDVVARDLIDVLEEATRPPA